MTINMEQARFNMVEQQVRTWDVLDQTVLDALRGVPREDFVPTEHRRLAFSDLRLPLGHDQVMMKPVEEGRMLQALAVEPGWKVLEIGTGSGFVAACLAHMGAQVLSVDIIGEFVEQAHARVEKLGLENLRFEQADALGEFNPGTGFDAIAITGSLAEVPSHFGRWLKPGGRLFAVRGHSPSMEAVLKIRTDNESWQVESLFDTDLPRLIGAEDRPRFEF